MAIRTPMLLGLLSTVFFACDVGESYTVAGDDQFEYHEEDDMVVPVPTDPTFNASGSGRGPEVVFLNFEGANLREGGWAPGNAQNNVSFIVRTGNATIPAFDHTPWGTNRSSVINSLIARLDERFSGYSVRFTSSRPASGEYTMIMMGGLPSLVGKGAQVLGTAPFDSQNYNNDDIAFVFTERVANSNYDLQGLANITAHELGHSVGLRHIDRDGDVMYPSACHCEQSWGAGPVVGSPEMTQDDREVLARAFPAPQASRRDGRLCGGTTRYAHARQPGWTEDEMRSVGRLYCGLLDRSPDPGGFNHYMSQLKSGYSYASLANGFINSPEFTTRFGSQQSMSNSDYVHFLYQVVLDREPDAGGLAGWTGALQRGSHRATVAAGILGSDEAKIRLDGIFAF